MIVIIEKSLDVLNGHEHTQIKAIRDLVPGREIGVVTHHEFSADKVPIGGRVSPVFSTNRETLHDPVGARARDAKTLCSLIEDPGVDAPVSFVVPSACPHELRVGLEVLDRTDAARFHYRIIRPEVMAALEPSEIAAVGEAISQGKISLHTETRELSDHISDAYGLVAEDDFLLPCTIDPAVDPVGSPGEGEGRTVRIGYLGNYRTEKGSESISDILDALGHRVSASPGKTRLEIVVQWPARIQSKPRKLIYVIKIMAIAARHFPRGRLRIKWYRGGIPTDEFLTLLKSLDL
ncbi:MAG: hypothetical protein HKO04_01045, partial [Silicimonas sp.]|nr:hypothetical protein [Silicimonas sp.]